MADDAEGWDAHALPGVQMIRRSMYDERVLELAVACLIVVFCAVAVWLWGPS
jgi:hypothetical protein